MGGLISDLGIVFSIKGVEEFSCCMFVIYYGINVDEIDKYIFNCLRGILVYVCYGCG